MLQGDDAGYDLQPAGHEAGIDDLSNRGGRLGGEMVARLAATCGPRLAVEDQELILAGIATEGEHRLLARPAVARISNEALGPYGG